MASTQNQMGPPAPDEPPDDNDRSRANIVALIFIVLLFACAYWLFTEMQRHREIESCVASGRRDCIPLAPADKGSP